MLLWERHKYAVPQPQPHKHGERDHHGLLQCKCVLHGCANGLCQLHCFYLHHRFADGQWVFQRKRNLVSVIFCLHLIHELRHWVAFTKPQCNRHNIKYGLRVF